MRSHHFDQSAVVLTPNQSCDVVALDSGLYEKLDRDYAGFVGHTLIAMHHFTENWPTWERHPKGDEIVCLISGSAEFVVRTTEGEQRVVLDSPGSFVLVPRNTWHTAHIADAATCLFFTPGEGTENTDV